MAFEEPTSEGNYTFLRISKGAFTKDGEAIVNDQGYTKPLTGFITSIERHQFKYNRDEIFMYKFKMEDSKGNKYAFDIERTSRYSRDLINRLLECDLGLAVTLTPYQFETDTGLMMGVSVKQNGQKVAGRYSKENECSVAPKVYKVKGKEHYDFMDQVEHMYNELSGKMTNIEPLVKKEVRQDEIIEEMVKSGDWEKTDKKAVSDDDDLPF